MKKRIISLLLALILLFAFAVPAIAESENTVTLRSPKEVLCYGLRDDNGPLSITKCVLHTEQGERDVYLICLSGASYNITQHNNFAEFFMSAVSLPTGYLRAVKNAAKSVIPEGSAVLLCGHSLGGTTAQQFAADRSMRSRYEILNVCACGSPYIVELKREGSLHRLGEVLDIAPYISLAGPLNLFLYIHYEIGGFSGQFRTPHETSYYMSPVWDAYDCFGVKNGTAYLTADPSDTVNFQLPIKLF